MGVPLAYPTLKGLLTGPRSLTCEVDLILQGPAIFIHSGTLAAPQLTRRLQAARNEPTHKCCRRTQPARDSCPLCANGSAVIDSDSTKSSFCSNASNGIFSRMRVDL
jgi:hypothetical protein